MASPHVGRQAGDRRPGEPSSTAVSHAEALRRMRAFLAMRVIIGGIERRCQPVTSRYEAQINGVLIVLRGWFDRSLCNAIYDEYWRKHPTFDLYVSMILGRLGDMYKELNLYSR